MRANGARTWVGCLAVGLLSSALFSAPAAEARGGRAAVPPAARSPAASREGEPRAANEEALPPPGSTDTPAGETPTRGVPLPTLRGGAGRRARAPVVGATDWVAWYEPNRERIEDLRARARATHTNPIFQVGPGGLIDRDRLALRIPPGPRARILAAIRGVFQASGEHWIHTRAAAYVALGRIAETAEDLDPHFEALDPDSDESRYIRESAVLGLGHLRRGDADRRLSARLLDRVRARLAAVLDDPMAYQPNTRAHAAVALGLLADQPSRLAESGPGQAHEWTGRRLLGAWLRDDLPEETQVGVLVGVARLGERGVPPVMRLVLEGCALRGRAWPRSRSAVVRAHAALALAHVAGAEHTPTFERLLTGEKGGNAVVGQAAALAATIHGERIPAARARLARAVLRRLEARPGEPGGRRLGLAALGRLLAADAPAGLSEVLEGTRARRFLLLAARRGPAEERCFAALALAMAARAVPDQAPTWGWHTLRNDALEALRAGLADRRLDVHARAAFATALGIARDGRSVARLLALLENHDVAPELRAYAALGLGLIGDAREEVVGAIRSAVREPRDETLRVRAATALGLLGGGTAEDRRATIGGLIHELVRTPHQASKGQFALTLGRIGGTEAVDELTRLLADPKAAHLNRAMACAALGLISEEERHPALASTRWNSHHLSSSQVVRDLNDLL